MNTIKTFLRPFYKIMMLGLFVKGVGSIVELFIPYILALIIDDIVPTNNTNLILIWGLIMIGCAVFAWLANIYANRKAAMVARNTTKNLRHALFDKTIYLSCKQTDDFTIPSLESRLTSDTYHVHRMLGMIQRMGVRAPILLVGGITMTMIMEPILALVLIAILPFITFIIYIRAAKGVPLFGKVQKAADKMITVVRENAQGIRVIKALSKTDHEQRRYQNVNEKLKKTEKKANIRMALINPSMNLFLNIGLTLVIVVGAYRVNLGSSETGKIIAFMSYFTIISNAMMSISRIFVMYSRGMASANRIGIILDHPLDPVLVSEDYPEGDPAYAIEFKNVTFSYLKIKPNLKNISFKLRKGETLGIIGATGAGKTTIMQLLLRFYDIDEGAIYINGKDIRSYKPSELRKQFGIVMQNDFIFSDSIKENIAFGREIKEEDIDSAVENAQAMEFIRTLEERYEYSLTSKGTNLSGGQKQRILLSRAFVTHPAFFLLDDSSSALDYKTDAELRKTISEHYHDATMIIIAQRISSIKNADQIVVLNNGEINAFGTHQQLMNTSTLYASISDSQMGGALLD